jgi:hypothetical protein
MTPVQARDVAHLLARGVFTHDHPVQAGELTELGSP